MGFLRAMPGATPNLVYACDPWEIDLGRRELRSRGAPVFLGQRAFEIIETLALPKASPDLVISMRPAADWIVPLRGRIATERAGISRSSCA
jgi:hypothetical protein